MDPYSVEAPAAHRLVQLWLPMGATANPPIERWPTLHCAATEESGIAELTLFPGPVALDRHRAVPADGNSVHLDVAYVAVTRAGAVENRSDESLDLQWFVLDGARPIRPMTRAPGWWSGPRRCFRLIEARGDRSSRAKDQKSLGFLVSRTV